MESKDRLKYEREREDGWDAKSGQSVACLELFPNKYCKSALVLSVFCLFLIAECD